MLINPPQNPTVAAVVDSLIFEIDAKLEYLPLRVPTRAQIRLIEQELIANPPSQRMHMVRYIGDGTMGYCSLGVLGKALGLPDEKIDWDTIRTAGLEEKFGIADGWEFLVYRPNDALYDVEPQVRAQFVVAVLEEIRDIGDFYEEMVRAERLSRPHVSRRRHV